MAILDVLPGLEITIESQGKALSEYEDDMQWTQWAGKDKYSIREDRWASTYVECKSDTEFGIKMAVNPPFKFLDEGISFDVTIDGQRVGHRSLTKRKGSSQGRSKTLSWLRQRINPNEVAYQALKFAAVKKGKYCVLSHQSHSLPC